MRETQFINEINKYNKGLEILFCRLDSNDPYFFQARNLEMQLNENIEKAKVDGDSERKRSERIYLISELNKLTHSRLGITFLQLCGVIPLHKKSEWGEIQILYLEQLEVELQEWRAKYTDLRLTTDIRVASYKGQRVNYDVREKKWWFRDLINDLETTGNLSWKKIIILGDPGGGKTTLCQHATWELAKNGIKASRRKLKARTPIYLEMSTYREDSPEFRDLKPHQRILCMIAEEVTRILSGGLDPIVVNWQQVEKFLVGSKFIFFFDGLNEVGRSHRESLIIGIINFIVLFSEQDHQFVITTRKFDYEYDISPFFPPDVFETLEILELDNSGVNEFILQNLGEITKADNYSKKIPQNKVWAFNNYLSRIKDGDEQLEALYRIRVVINSLPDEYKPEGIEVINKLDSAVNLIHLLLKDDYRKVLWLGQNPSTLKDIIDVYRVNNTIPKSRVRLFEQAVLSRMHSQQVKQSDQRSLYSDDIKIKALKALAYEMVSPEGTLSIERDRVLKVFSTILTENGEKSESANHLLSEIIFKDYILVERVRGEYSFIKQPYHEYFVARELKEAWVRVLLSNKDPLRDIRLKHFFENRIYFQITAEMTGLLSSYQVNSLIKRLRKQKRTRRLAALCIRNAEEIDPSVIYDFIQWTQRQIFRFSYYPEGLSNILIIVLASLLLVFFINSDLLSLASSLVIVVHRIFQANYSLISIISSMLTILIAFGVWYFSYRSDQRLTFSSRFYNVLFASLVIVQTAIFSGAVKGNLSHIGYTIVVTLLLILLQRFFNSVIVPLGAKTNSRIEDYIVNSQLIPFLEIMRDMGSDAGSHIISIQQRIMENKHMSERIRDAIIRTWVVSPRTALQVIDDTVIPERQAEAIKILQPTIIHYKTKPFVREKAVATIFQILEKCEDIGAALLAVETLESLAYEEKDYKNQVVALFKKMLIGSYPIIVRRKIWRALNNLGHKEPYPQSGLDRLKILFLIVLFFIAIPAVLIFIWLFLNSR
jgi:ribosomal protein L22